MEYTGRWWLKRLLDMSLTPLIVLILSPVLATIWCAVRLTSPGPAIYRQQRVGRRGSRFFMYKFRSMYVNAEDGCHRKYVMQWMKDGKKSANADGVFKLAGDKRITPLGHFLRRYSLDELPQLFNILKGEMSLVGPRPALPYEVEAYQPWQMERLDALPGITGLWQVGGRNALSFEEMVRLDIAYVRRQGLVLDLVILARTIPTVLLGTGH